MLCVQRQAAELDARLGGAAAYALNAPWVCPTCMQVTKLEELWKLKPTAGLDEVQQVEGEEGTVTPVALKYEDSAQYQVRHGCMMHAACT